MIMLQSLEQRPVWEKFGSYCKRPPVEIVATLLNVRTATESTNMMFFTSAIRQSQNVLVITMASNQFCAQLPRGSEGTLVNNGVVSPMMLLEQSNRCCAPNVRRKRMDQDPWNGKFLQLTDDGDHASNPLVFRSDVWRERLLSPSI